MALSIETEILGQEANSTTSYCYLYEPLRINIIEDDLLAVKLYVDIERIDIETQTTVDTFVKYGEFDINPSVSFSFDMMDLINQLHDSNIYKMGTIDSILESGKYSVISKYIYKLSIYSDKTETALVIRKLPIIGGREFSEFIPQVSSTQFLTEFQQYGINEEELAQRWSGYTFLKTSLINIASTGSLIPTITEITPTDPTACDGGILIWKSSLGGWMFWGFDLNRKSKSHRYTGNLDVGKFKGDKRRGGNPYVEINYTGVDTSYTIELKALGLSIEELKAVSGISSSTAVYYTNNNSGRLELMRISSVSVPISNKALGGDFTVSLENISVNSQKTL